MTGWHSHGTVMERRRGFPGNPFNKGLHGGETILRFYRERLHDRLFHLRRQGNAQLRGLFQRIVMDPHDGIRRQLPGHAAVQGGAHGVYIRPRPLVPLTGILLLRRVAMFQDDRHAFFISDRKPGRAEIQQLALSLGGNGDVVRADIPVGQVQGMNLRQRLHHRHQDGQRLVIGNLPALGCNVCLQAHAVDIFHHEIGRVVFLKIILHRHDVRRILQFGKDPRFL